MMDEMANHAARVRTYVDRYGLLKVEGFLDRCLSIDNLVDPYHPEGLLPRPKDTDDQPAAVEPRRIKGPSYMEKYLNPEEYLEQQKERITREREALRRIPPRPERDVMGFLLEYAPLEPWERNLLALVREEALYFSPQGMTKIMNEGWASYWHSRITTERVLGDEEIVDYADHCAGVFAMPQGSFNPYKVGLELWRDIEERWNKGRFGVDWEQCEDYEKRLRWDTGAGKGQEKIFEVRRLHNDVTFIDTFLTPDFCDRAQLFTYRWNERTRRFEIAERDFLAIKQQLLFQLTNHGRPVVRIVEANHENRSELLLAHDYQGIELDLGYARDTLRNLARIWGRPVHLHTVLGEKEKLLSHDGAEFREREA
jgi:stage V sporulation protein R